MLTALASTRVLTTTHFLQKICESHEYQFGLKRVMMTKSKLLLNECFSAILPELVSGRGTARSVVEGSHGEVCAAADRWDPSVASRHLPVPGRI